MWTIERPPAAARAAFASATTERSTQPARHPAAIGVATRRIP
jgi:hypothetical protein